MFYEVVPEGKVGRLTYSFDDSLLAGQIVMVPLGKRVVPGVVIKKVVQPGFKTKSIVKVLYSKPLPKRLLNAAEFIRDYYMVEEGEAMSLILPRGIEKKRRKTEQMFGNSLSETGLGKSFHSGPRPAGPSPRAAGANSRAAALRNAPSSKCYCHPSPIKFPDIPLNPAQKNALQGLQEAPGTTKLLFGVTGSGNTNVYLQEALNAFQGHKSVILLVPEIALTGQVVRVSSIKVRLPSTITCRSMVSVVLQPVGMCAIRRMVYCPGVV